MTAKEEEKTTTAKAKKKETVAKKKPAAKKAPVKKKAESAKVAKKVVKAPKVAALKKESSTLSKGKKRKIRIEDKFSERRYEPGVGKRKSSIALVRLYQEGKGKVFINNIELEKYFFGTLVESSLHPIALVGKTNTFDITVKVTGGGVTSQAEAVRHGISKALIQIDPELKPILKKAGLLTRDARVKERKKPGLKRARRAPQWKKR